MRRGRCRHVFFFLFAVFTLASPQGVLAFDADILPERVYPGDPFLITVRDAPAAPEAHVEGRALAFVPCGKDCYRALGAFGPRHEPGTYEVRLVLGGTSRALAVTVLEGSFPVQQLALPDQQVFLGTEDLIRVEQETARFKALWETATPEARWEGPFIMPLPNGFSTAFGVRRIINGTKTTVHRGVDIRGRAGEPVLAANTGRVVMAEDTFYGGNTIVIDHGASVYSIYMHLSRFNVVRGEYITKGDVVGFVGSTGRSTGPHLHYSVKVGGETANPVALTALPLGGEPPAFSEAPPPILRGSDAVGSDGER